MNIEDFMHDVVAAEGIWLQERKTSRLPKIGMFRVLLLLTRGVEKDKKTGEDRPSAAVTRYHGEVFSLDFKYRSMINAEFFDEDCLSDVDYDMFSEVLGSCPPGLYEVMGDFHYSGGIDDYSGEYDFDSDLCSMGARALTKKDADVCLTKEELEETMVELS